MSNTIILYQKSNEAIPALEFLDGLNAKRRAKGEYRITQLRTEGHKLRYPASDIVREGIFELRWEVNTDIFRILYFFADEGIVLLNGFQKKDRKISPEEIERAYRYRADYQVRKGGIEYDGRSYI